MTPVRLLHIAGHDLASIAFNAGQSGVPVIFLHGVASSIYFWQPDLVAPFCDGGPCYALSLPGHYPAVFPPHSAPGDLTAESIARVLALAIRELVGERPVLLVGHSTGGFAALAIAAYTPEIAHGVISVAGFAHGQWNGSLGMSQRWSRSGALGRWGFKAFYNLFKIHPILIYAALRIYTPRPERLFANPNLKTSFKSLDFQAYRNLNLDAMLIYFSRMPDIDITSLLPRITAPALVITGDADLIVPPAQAHLIAERVPRAKLVVLEGGVGHLPCYEVPEVYRRAIENWFPALSSGRDG